VLDAHHDEPQRTRGVGAVVRCLLAASYTEREIVDYLERAYGLTLEEAVAAVAETSGPVLGQSAASTA
jgi:hypothetical protein